jgi:hypothetical protein
MMPVQQYQLILLPYLGLDNRTVIRYGRVTIWCAALLDEYTSSTALRERVRLLLAAYRDGSTRDGKPEPLTGIGIVSVGEPDFAPLSASEFTQLHEARYALFLATLASNVRWYGSNAGHYIHTAENFGIVSQNFQLTGEFISETSGVIVQRTNMGLKLSEVQFTRPSYVPQPMRLDYDKDLFHALARLRRRDPKQYRRILDAAALFIESYYNTPSVDVRARVLLQVAAFEVLFALPERNQRQAFKDKIEELCGNRGERKYRYKYQVRSRRVPESRTLKGIWADRFYTLRNHIIHGERVRQSAYLFRGQQHHLIAAPIFFVLAIKRMLVQRLGGPVALFDRIDWQLIDEADDGSPRFGFMINPDFDSMVDCLIERQNASSRSTRRITER